MTIRERIHFKPHPADEKGCVLHISPAIAHWDYVGFDVFRMKAGSHLDFDNGDKECCAVVVSGAATFTDGEGGKYESGLRRSPFAPDVWAFYTARDSHWSATAKTELELALCYAPGKKTRPPRLITPDSVVVEKRGEGSNRRIVTDLLPEDQDVADSLLVLEAVTPSGNWSSYPPHKHDEDRLPAESKLEEVYYHRMNPTTGFAFQRVYTDDGRLDETVAVKDGEVVLVPFGYHPVGAPHGYDLYYLNVMAGPKRIWRTYADPEHAWILDAN